MNYRALGVAIALCLAVAALEGMIGADGVLTWYPTLKKPDWHLPMAAFIAVAMLVYLIDGFVAYRLWAATSVRGSRVIGLTSLAVVMVYNALWNYAFFESESTLIGLLGLLAFLGPLLMLQVTLCVYDTMAALVHGVYLAWVVLYDLPLFYTIWRLNS